jgi:hypothetical protein
MAYEARNKNSWALVFFTSFSTTTAANIVGGKFSIPAPTQVEAQANALNVGAIICLTNPTTPATAVPSVQLVYPVNPSGVPSPPGTVPSPVTTGQTMANPPSGWVTQFTPQGSITSCSGTPTGNYYFTPAVVYTFQPPQINSTTSLITVPGQILRNGLPFLGGDAQVQSTSSTQTAQESFFSVYDFQVRGLFIPPGGGTQKWAPTDATFCSLITTSNLRYVEIKILYTIIQGTYSNIAAQKQANALKTVTRLIQVNPRAVVLSQY